MKVQFIFKWFDFWVGLFYDRKKKWLYILPIPMFGIILKFDKPKDDSRSPWPDSPWDWQYFSKFY
jgi:hypothetical protein